MSSPDLQTVVIACPNCGTRYQVPYATIGAAGREVQCAHENDLFEMDTFSLRTTAEQQRKLNRGSWIDA